ncbi:hypothetical protein [Rhodococcus wratislaviensis]|uniref:hypothetical protein n=1 Tax=Rhodococcus wratislaviensis TaxID=44752 RepID=UPI0036473AF6
MNGMVVVVAAGAKRISAPLNEAHVVDVLNLAGAKVEADEVAYSMAPGLGLRGQGGSHPD